MAGTPSLRRLQHVARGGGGVSLWETAFRSRQELCACQHQLPSLAAGDAHLRLEHWRPCKDVERVAGPQSVAVTGVATGIASSPVAPLAISTLSGVTILRQMKPMRPSLALFPSLLGSFFHSSPLRPQAAAHAAASATEPEAESEPEPEAETGSAGSKATAEQRSPPTERVQKLVDEIAGLTLLEVSDLTKLLKRKLGLPDMPMGGMPMMMPPGMGMPAAGSAPAAGAAEEPVVEKTSFDVKLAKFDAASKLKIIKEVRAITGLGLKESKELVESAPAVLKRGVPKEEAESIVEKLKAVGAEMELE